MGMHSLLFGAGYAGADADAVFNDWRQLPALLNGNQPG